MTYGEESVLKKRGKVPESCDRTDAEDIYLAYEYRRNGSGRECITVCPGIVEAWSRFGVPYVSQRMSWAVTCK